MENTSVLSWNVHGLNMRARRHAIRLLVDDAKASWHVWKERNARLCRNDAQNHQQLLQKLKIEAELWITAGRDGPRLFIWRVISYGMYSTSNSMLSVEVVVCVRPRGCMLYQTFLLLS